MLLTSGVNCTARVVLPLVDTSMDSLRIPVFTFCSAGCGEDGRGAAAASTNLADALWDTIRASSCFPFSVSVAERPSEETLIIAAVCMDQTA